MHIIISTIHMYNVTYLLDGTSGGYSPIALDIISFVAIVFAISVIIIKNPISSILSLIALFFSIACYLTMIGLTFIGLSYLLVYVGAVSILFLFILMLINVRVSELTMNTKNSIPLVLIVAIIFTYNINDLLPTNSVSILTYIYKNIIPYINYYYNFISDPDVNFNTTETLLVTSKSWDGNVAEAVHITSIGNIMYTTYFIWLMITSIILLLAMVGCIIITIKDNNNEITTNIIY